MRLNRHFLLFSAAMPLQSYAFSASTSERAKVSTTIATSTINTSPSSCRIFIGGLSERCTKNLLQESFQPFGTILDISIVGMNDDAKKKSKRKPSAFVTFDSPESAKDAIQNHQTVENGDDNNEPTTMEQFLFQQVQMENPMNQKDRSRSNAARQKEQEYRDSIIDLCKSTNLILQVQTTHAERLSSYLETIQKDYSDLEFKVEGLNGAARRNMSLLFLSSSDPIELALRLHHDPIIARALKKCYVVNKTALEVEMNEEKGNKMAIYNSLAMKMKSDSKNPSANENEEKSYRLHAFPPSTQSNLLAAIHKINNDPSSSEKITLNPRKFTDVLSVVQVYTYKGRGNLLKEVKENGVVMSGVSPSFLPINSNIGNEDDSAVNRAYFKLQEAMGRYYRDFNDTNETFFHDSIALDCGAAPGGWSKFLADDMKCRMVYSVDPGKMTIDLANVDHLQMKIQDAIPIIKERNAKIKVFVSDMCLHEMEAQLDFLLLAREEGILEDETFFVLTLKVTGGYSKVYFDGEAQKVMDALHAKADVGIKTRDTVTYHLFSNRNGERTIMGYIMS